MTQQRTVRKRERKSERESGREAHTGSTFTQDATDVSDFMPKQHSSHSAHTTGRSTPAVVSGGLAQVT